MTIRTDIDIDEWLDEIHLDAGEHNSPDDGMCVMEAIAWLVGDDFNASPACVSPVIRAFAISWNDVLDDDDRDRLLKPLMLNMVGTNTNDPVVESALAWMATDWLVRVHTPAWLRLAGLEQQAQQLLSLGTLTADSTPKIMPALEAVRSDAAAAGAAAWAAAWAAARDAARAAAWDAAGDAARAAARDAAGDAAGDAARAAARDAAGDAARAAARAAAGTAARAAARDAAGDAAGDAARDALSPTVVELQDSASDLVRRMCEYARASHNAGGALDE